MPPSWWPFSTSGWAGFRRRGRVFCRLQLPHHHRIVGTHRSLAARGFRTVLGPLDQAARSRRLYRVVRGGGGGIVMMPKSRWKDTIEQVAASALYLENWALAFRSVDYLAQHEAVSPVQHFWALSVQGQFYLLWPMLVAGAALIARRAGIAFRTVLVAALAVIFALSLAFSIYFTAKNQPFAYFHTARPRLGIQHGRAAGRGDSVSEAFQSGCGSRSAGLGVVAIISCGIVLQVSRVFPGLCRVVAHPGRGLHHHSRHLGIPLWSGSAAGIAPDGVPGRNLLRHLPVAFPDPRVLRASTRSPTSFLQRRRCYSRAVDRARRSEHPLHREPDSRAARPDCRARPPVSCLGSPAWRRWS